MTFRGCQNKIYLDLKNFSGDKFYFKWFYFSFYEFHLIFAIESCVLLIITLLTDAYFLLVTGKMF